LKIKHKIESMVYLILFIILWWYLKFKESMSRRRKRFKFNKVRRPNIDRKSDLTGKFRIIKSITGTKLSVEYINTEKDKLFRTATEFDKNELKRTKKLRIKIV
jgi:hypothetical protein